MSLVWHKLWIWGETANLAMFKCYQICQPAHITSSLIVMSDTICIWIVEKMRSCVFTSGCIQIVKVLFCGRCVWYIFTVSPSIRWRRWRGGTRAAKSELLRLFHTHSVRFLEGSVCLLPAHTVLERMGVLHSVNLCHWFLNSHYWRPSFPLRLHRRPQRHGHCGGLCSAGDLPSW